MFNIHALKHLNMATFLRVPHPFDADTRFKTIEPTCNVTRWLRAQQSEQESELLPVDLLVSLPVADLCEEQP
jgi:hypothetical protein